MTKTPKTSPSPIRTETPLMTLGDIAKLEQISINSVRRAAAAGLLEVIRVGPAGRLVRVSQAAYRTYRARCAERV